MVPGAQSPANWVAESSMSSLTCPLKSSKPGSKKDPPNLPGGAKAMTQGRQSAMKGTPRFYPTPSLVNPLAGLLTAYRIGQWTQDHRDPEEEPEQGPGRL